MIKKLFSLTFADTALRGGRFIFFIALTLIFSKDTVGIYSYLTSILAILSVIGDFGLGVYITKEVSRYPSNTEELIAFKSTFSISLFIMFLIYLLFMDRFLLGFFITVFFVADLVLSNHYSLHRGLEDIKTEVYSKIFTGILYAFSTLFIFFEVSDTLFFGIFSLSYLMLALYVGRGTLPKITKLDTKRIYKIFQAVKFIFLGGALTVIYFRVDILMIGSMLDMEQLANYTLAARFLELSLVLPQALAIIMLPQFIKSKKVATLKNGISQSLISLIAVLVLLFILPFFIKLFFNNTYNASLPTLSILLLSLPAIVFNSYFFTYFVSIRKEYFYFLSTLYMTLFNVGLNFIFIPILGIEGAALTTLGTEFLGSLLCYYFFRRSQNLLE